MLLGLNNLFPNTCTRHKSLSNILICFAKFYHAILSKIPPYFPGICIYFSAQWRYSLMETYNGMGTQLSYVGWPIQARSLSGKAKTKSGQYPAAYCQPWLSISCRHKLSATNSFKEGMQSSENWTTRILDTLGCIMQHRWEKWKFCIIFDDKWS